MRGAVPSWGVFDDFRAPPRAPKTVPTWDAIEQLGRHAAEAAGAQQSALDDALARWHQRLEAIGGEPAFRDWSRFRPLRLSREEDWSDWLAHLVETSKQGFLAAPLLGDPHSRAERVKREVSTLDGFRADLVIEWRDGRCSHIEVKTGDTQFEKTWETAEALKAHHSHVDRARWTDHILLPPGDVTQWQRELRDRDAVKTLTWRDVAVALRRSLFEAKEAVDWRVWAAAFTGAIEQTLLGLPMRSEDRSAPRRLAQVLLAGSHLALLEEATSK